MAWTIGAQRKIGPQTIMQHIEVPVTTDSTTPTAVAHGFSKAPDEFYIRSQTGGTHLCVLAANGTDITVTPSAAATTFVLVSKTYGQDR